MKQFKIKMRVKISRTTMSMVETVINANTAVDAKHLAEAQYGDKLDYIINVTEIK